MNSLKSKKILTVIVTHNSHKFINWCIEPLIKVHDICDIRIVDSGSTDISYLKQIEGNVQEIHYENNIGFAKANNRALYDLNKYSAVLFLNPDARIESDCFQTLYSRLNTVDHNYGIFSVPLVKFDINNYKKEGVYDSLGIVCDKVGRWYDVRGQVTDELPVIPKIDAICGAFMLIPSKVLDECKTSTGGIGFDESYYMYKEDIELSLRVSKKYKLKIYNDIYAFHCRGWNKDRKSVPYWSRLISAKNDIKLAFSYRTKNLPFAYIKYLYVRFIEAR
ncbi:TPA: glycosyltransferase [Raoultella ornithinolytica]|uniref:glycosyltransferase n=1 Tax=Raoultella TaxID=160674 RepID=UPI0010E58C0C|nr:MULTISPECIES: glycosyltransferase [Raoultella]VTN55177.1 Glycosyl transferase family 2 [Raoultella ornithinolytica]HED1778822.1 glycosyltransferase [Raoultella ornithinolytica]